ncbi:MAG: DoxX family protein [Gammaproteobacteria bacterium]
MNLSHTVALKDDPVQRGSIDLLAQCINRIYRGLTYLTPVADLVVRWWVAQSFFKAGLTKIANFDSTILLFTYEYQVPLLAPETAAAMGTATELSMPILLALGLLSRASAGILFVFNLVAVLSYPAISIFTAIDHQAWAIMLLVTLLHGPGKLSLDHLISRKLPQWPQ